MDIPEKLRFINDLTDNVKMDIIKKVADMPEEWDGIELRWYIAGKFSELPSYGGSYSRRSKRYQDYRNFIMTKGNF